MKKQVLRILGDLACMIGCHEWEFIVAFNRGPWVPAFAVVSCSRCRKIGFIINQEKVRTFKLAKYHG